MKADCHEIKDAKILEGYLKKVNEDPVILCNHLELENCNQLKYGDSNKLKPLIMAESYLTQRAGACWENIVSMLCQMKMRRLANEVAEKWTVMYKRYCDTS